MSSLTFPTKEALLAAGADVVSVSYQRASRDPKHQGTSVGTQKVRNGREIKARGWTWAESYTDNDRSASRHARKPRPEYEDLLDRIEGGGIHVLVLFELARGQRDLAVYAAIRDLCMSVGLFFWDLNGVLYDLRDKSDRMTLGILAVQAEFMADYIRDNIQSTVNMNAERGRPHGANKYGYERIYRRRKLVEIVPDERQHTAVTDSGVETYTHAGIVREIFEKISKGVGFYRVEKDLKSRQIPGPRGGRWRHSTIRSMVMDAGYLGKRILRDQVVGDAMWPALVDEDTFNACQVLLTDPDRKTGHATGYRWWLTFIGECGKCGGPLMSHRTKTKRSKNPVVSYVCKDNRCASMKMEIVDAYVEECLLAYLSSPNLYEALMKAATRDDRKLMRLREQYNQVSAELEDWRRASERGDVTLGSFIRKEKASLARLKTLDEQMTDAAVPDVVRDLAGEHARQKWAALSDHIEVRRQVARETLRVVLMPAGRGQRNIPVADRVTVSFILGQKKETQKVTASAD